MSADLRRYILSPLAENDLEDIWLYTFQNWSIDQADKYQPELMVVIEELAKGKKAGCDISDIRAGYMKYGVGRHFLFYRLSEDHMDIIRILHQQMDVSAHLEI